MSTDMKIKVSEIQRFCMHDGPGVRTTIFLKGCPLRCEWCHNPETQKAKSELLFYKNKCIGCGICESVCQQNAHMLGEEHFIDRNNCASCFECAKNCPTGALEICGKDMTAEEILSVIEKDRAFYGDAGGVTLSGGEPFMQKDAALSLLKVCKARGISTAVETCGCVDTETLRSAVPFVDLFLWDLKDTDCERHKLFTGVSNEKILKNLCTVNEMGAKIRLRCILINGVNTDALHYEMIADIAKKLQNLDGVEFIPYHAYGGTKATFVGEKDNGKTELIPSTIQIENAKEILRNKNVTVIK